MNKYIQILLIALAGGVGISFSLAMIYTDGRADINTRGEGWIEAALSLALFIVGGLSMLNKREA